MPNMGIVFCEGEKKKKRKGIMMGNCFVVVGLF